MNWNDQAEDNSRQGRWKPRPASTPPQDRTGNGIRPSPSDPEPAQHENASEACRDDGEPMDMDSPGSNKREDQDRTDVVRRREREQ
jgi:hypothetical protein